MVQTFDFKIRLIDLTELKTLDCKDKGSENRSFWQELNSFKKYVLSKVKSRDVGVSLIV